MKKSLLPYILVVLQIALVFAAWDIESTKTVDWDNYICYFNFFRVMVCLTLLILAQVLGWIGICVNKRSNRIINYITFVFSNCAFLLWSFSIIDFGPYYRPF